jgi:hypothetical protein
MDINSGDEIWLDGQIILFNGWPPNIRMIVMENYIIGIAEDDVSSDLKKHLPDISPKGRFKLKLVYKTDVHLLFLYFSQGIFFHKCHNLYNRLMH